MYRDVKRLITTNRNIYDFRVDRLGEGAFVSLTASCAATFMISGAWSYVHISSGIKHNEVNTLLHAAAIESGWSKDRAQLFRLELIGVFNEEIGHYCSCEDDLGIYCPDGSEISSPEAIINKIEIWTEEHSYLADLAQCLHYTYNRQLFGPVSAYMIPAAAALLGDREILNWSNAYFQEQMPLDERDEYNSMVCNIIKLSSP